jgi:hypothetical protein
MKILVFTEGTLIMHSAGIDRSRKEIVKQVEENEPSVKNYGSYVPVGRAQLKLKSWIEQGAELFYLTSRKTVEEIQQIRNVLDKNNFPKGDLIFREQSEEYRNVAERIKPDILIEDDCESIGGEKEMTYTHIKPEIKNQIKSVVIKEFSGIDSLPDNLDALKLL